MKRYRAGLAMLLATIVIIPTLTKATYLQDGITYSSNEIVIAIKANYAPVSPILKNGIMVSGLNEIDALNRKFSVVKMWPLFPKAEKHGEPAMAGYYSLTFRDGLSLQAVLEEYAKLPIIEHVEPVGIHRVSYTPNDPSLSSQWAMTTIDARQAWDIGRGDSTVPLGIADTGVDWDHPDLDGNIWYNFDDPVDGIDNDGNGYIDDIRGWDWVDFTAYPAPDPGDDGLSPDNNPMDYYGHGTHCAGIASAETNNGTGVAGVGFKCSIMCLRIGWKATNGNGYVSMSYAASAFYYAANNGARAINCSWGSDNSGGISTATAYAVGYPYYVVIVSAAGNDNSQTAPYLCSRSDVIAVAATDQSDQKASFSNYGTWVDVSAPGVSIYSTYFDNTYTYMDGTSMAAPHVVGLVGLIRAAVPSWSRTQVTSRILNTAEDIDALNPGYEGKLGSGRINAALAMAGLGVNLATPIPISPILNNWINLPHTRFTWSDTSLGTKYHIQVDQQSNFGSPNINDSTITDTTFVSPDSLVDGTWYWHIRGGIGEFWTDFSANQPFRIDTRKPNTAVLLTPVLNSSTNNLRPYFSWQPVTDVGGSGISFYYIDIDNDSLFNQPLLSHDSLQITHFVPNYDLPGNSRIFWRVRARDVAGNYGLYATSKFNIDNTAPPAPIAFSVSPHSWTANPSFTLTWTNPIDPSGISSAYYKVGSAPTSNTDTSGHFSGTPPAAYTAHNTGPSLIYLWLVDGVGNSSYLQRAQDTIKYDNTPPSGSIASSPSISGELSFNVSWSSGSDVGSGLAGLYDVRSKDSLDAVWSNWLVGVSGLSATFNGQHGHSYYFEARARDLVGNLEPFEGITETSTHVDTTYAGPAYLPGDANGSGTVSGLDVVFLIRFFKGLGPAPDPLLSGDANGSCTVSGLDVTYLVRYFKGGPAPFIGDCKR
ncbi:MAG TPA: hypothetical protein DEO84_03110 [candidate division Zixibacteria bacterium]|nr:hypothetical protein [candidate division Zixibacteria bacterium]HBZ00290.1 hypothetical protein [candidate division Zixibacteria bacterium]